MKFRTPKPTLLGWRATLLCGVFVVVTGCSEVEWERSQKASEANRQGVKALTEGDTATAQRRFMESLSQAPDEALYQINLGLSFEKAKRPEEALRAYNAALDASNDPQMDFVAHFNKGRLQGEAKRYEEAYQAYQAALDTEPAEEFEQETKINIELLAQKQKQEQKKKKKKKSGKNQKKKKKGSGKKNGKKDSSSKKQKKKKKNQKKKYTRKQQPKEFKSKKLNKNDVRRIFEELKRQEQEIRAKYDKDKKPSQPQDGKDW